MKAELLLGEGTGRLRAPVGDLPAGVRAVTVPVRRGGQARVQRDRRRHIRIGDVDLISGQPAGAFDPPPGMPAKELAFVLEAGRRAWQTIEDFFGRERAWRTAIALVLCGGVVLRCGTDENLDLGLPVSWRLSHAWSLQRSDLLNDLRGRPDPGELRSELLGLMDRVGQLSSERDLLAAAERDSPLRVPRGSATGTEAWSVYERAIRAAAIWWPHRSSAAEPLTAKALASKAFRDSKGWTAERELAFANLTGGSFDQMVAQADTDLRVRGPMTWRIGRVAADAAVAEPWVAVPAAGIHAAGIVRCDAVGVLLIENSDTFEQVCKVPQVTAEWLCVWGSGQASDGVVALLSHLAPRPVAAWCDLDADGINIINVLRRKLNREIHPVGMDLELWQSAPHRRQTPAQISRDNSLAAKLAVTGPESHRPLAQEIAAHGGSCEQEAIQDQVVPTLTEKLCSITSRGNRKAVSVQYRTDAGNAAQPAWRDSETGGHNG